MKRYPNPWVFGPAALGMVVAAWLGYFIAELSGTGTAVALIVAAAAGLGAAIGVGIVAVLAIRSFAEWKSAEDDYRPLPSAGGENTNQGSTD